MRDMRPKLLILAVLAVVPYGCGGSDDGGAAAAGADLAASFGQRSAQAYAERGGDREMDFVQGLIDVDCFAIDEGSVERLGLALSDDGGDYAAVNNTVLGPPGEEEVLSCGINRTSDDPSGQSDGTPVGTLSVGTTTADAEELRGRLLSGELSGDGGPDDMAPTEIEGEAPGLDPDSVVAVEDGGGARFFWLEDGFLIGVSASAEQLGEGDGYEALSVAVEVVSSALGGA